MADVVILTEDNWDDGDPVTVWDGGPPVVETDPVVYCPLCGYPLRECDCCMADSESA